ncbi:MAG: hypothetical protein SPK10_05335, partial [Treponema sp.]|nr:hypothetical protein [Treponema sp.]
EYYTYGGLPQILEFDSEKKKSDYLKNLYELTYMKDVQERNHLRNADGFLRLCKCLLPAYSLSQKIYCETLVAEFLTYHKYVHFKLI